MVKYKTSLSPEEHAARHCCSISRSLGRARAHLNSNYASVALPCLCAQVYVRCMETRCWLPTCALLADLPVLSSGDQGEEEEDYWMWLSSELCGVQAVSVSRERRW